jgi:hypothetical protein
MNELPGSLDQTDEAFIGVLFGEDELGVVVRAHIHVEAKLQELLELLVVDTKYFERMRLPFGQRVNLAVALGLQAEHAPALSALGTLRNAFAHHLDTKLSDERVNKLYDTLSPGDREVVQAAYEQTKIRMSMPEVPQFESLGPKSRFILISVALRGLLSAAIRETRARQAESSE